MKNLIMKSGMAVLACFGMSVSVSAQALTCSDLIWNDDVAASTAAACTEVVERDGRMWAKLSAQVVAQRPAGTYYRWVMPDGSLAPADTVAVENEDFLSMIDGEPVMIKDLPVRQKVNVYLGDAYWSLPAPEPMAVAEPEPEPEPMAEPEPEPEPEPVMLPKTAGQLPWLAVIGGLFLLLGGALRFARK